MEKEILILSMSEQIEKAFKSLMKSGRPDIINEDSENLIDKIYVDLFPNDYALNQVIDEEHLILQGRRGTGKSTIFLRAEEILLKKESKIPIYINLQTVIEELPKSVEENESDEFSYYRTYKNFMLSILESIKKEVKNKVKFIDKKELEHLFKDVINGIVYDKDFESSIEITSTKKSGANAKMQGTLSPVSALFKGEYGENHSKEEVTKETKYEKRVFSINETLNQLVRLLEEKKIIKIYLLLDDFSELDKSSQEMVVDSLISPIISSYNKNFVVKIAAYPGRVYRGNMDATKLPSLSLDFYDAFERTSTSSTYTEVEKYAMDYIERTLRTRIDVYTNYQIKLEVIFDDRNNLKDYMKELFHATACIPRALGFILNYCYLNSINRGVGISIKHIENAALKYFENNVLVDFQNDVRFKQSFHDDKDILDHFAQINLKNKLVENAKKIKKDAIAEYKSGQLKKIFKETLDQKKNNAYYFPTSHFYINTEKESLLQTLELYFIVSKFNQGSSKNSDYKESFFALNYGLCMMSNIDFGKPENRRDTYDYWRQSEFNYNSFIPQILSSIEEIVCEKCGRVYPEQQYEIYLENKNCFKCSSFDSVKKVNKLATKFKDKIAEWNKDALPDAYIEILRVLFNNQGKTMTAHQIALEIDKHHITVTNASQTLKNKGFLDFKVKGKRYYSITEEAISKFFTSRLDIETI